MEVIKRKILLENSIDRRYDSPTYGQITATSFYINVMLTQNVDDMGMFTDITYLPKLSTPNTPVNYGVLTQKLQASGITFPYMSGATVPNVSNFDVDTRYVGAQSSDFYRFGEKVTGITESRIDDVKTYNNAQQYQQGFNVENESYINFSGSNVNGISRITNFQDPITYVFLGDDNDQNLGTINQKDGLVFNDFVEGGITTFSFNGQGWNETNTSLSAITKEEYLFGIISKPEIKNDVFIDRGIATVFEKHLKLSEVRTLDELQRYGRGYFNVKKYQ